MLFFNQKKEDTKEGQIISYGRGFKLNVLMLIHSFEYRISINSISKKKLFESLFDEVSTTVQYASKWIFNGFLLFFDCNLFYFSVLSFIA